MANNVGFSVGEGVANGLAPFTEPSKRNIGLLFERERGVENTPFRISSLADDNAIFGGINANMYGPTVVRNLFKNAKGNPLTYYGVRIIGSTSVAATITTTVQTVAHTYTAAYQGSQDKGTWGNDLEVIFYSYGYKTTGKHTLEVYYNDILVETFEAATMAALQSDINANSGYVMTSLGAEYTTPAWTALSAGTITCTTSSKTVTGTSTAFTTDLVVGSLLRNSSGTTIGRVATITSATSIELEKNATVAVTAGTAEYYTQFKHTFTLTGGTYVAPVEADFYATTVGSTKYGLSLLDGVDVQIISVCENNTLTMAQELKSYVDDRQDPIAVVVTPLNSSESTIASWATALQSADKSFISVYNVWVKTSDGDGGYLTVPGTGCVLGAGYIRVPALQNDHIHIPPAGTDSAFVDVVEVYPETIDQATLNLYTRTYTVNSVVFRQRLGYFIMTSRTMSTNSLYQSVHIRMQTSYYVRVLQINMAFVIQRPNTPTLKRDIYSSLYSFFKAEYDKGALEQSVTFEEACIIVCDSTNNPASQARTELNADVEYIPTETTEATKINLNRNDGSLLVSAA